MQARRTRSYSLLLEKHYRLSWYRATLILSACEHNERGIILVILRSITVRRDRVLGIDIDESLIYPQLLKLNCAGVKSYGMASIEYIYIYIYIYIYTYIYIHIMKCQENARIIGI